MWINKIIAGMLPYMPKGLVWLFSKRYIAGKKIENAIETSRKLNEEGMMVTIDLLGEFITELKQAEDNKNEYLNIIDTIQKAKIDGNYSLKPTMFGLLIDTEVCYTNIREIVAKAGINVPMQVSCIQRMAVMQPEAYRITARIG